MHSKIFKLTNELSYSSHSLDQQSHPMRMKEYETPSAQNTDRVIKGRNGKPGNRYGIAKEHTTSTKGMASSAAFSTAVSIEPPLVIEGGSNAGSTDRSTMVCMT